MNTDFELKKGFLKQLVAISLCFALIISSMVTQVYAAEEITEPETQVEVVTEEVTSDETEESEEPTTIQETDLPAEDDEEVVTIPETDPAIQDGEEEKETLPESDPVETDNEEEISVVDDGADEIIVEEIKEESVPVFNSNSGIVDSGTCGDNLTWTLDEDGVLTISGEGMMTDWHQCLSPWKNNGYSQQIQSVVIEEGVENIGENAFFWCNNLTNASLPSSLTRIGSSAFNGCINLESITIPLNVTSIGSGAFNNCASLTSLEISSNVTSIGISAFDCSSLTSIRVASDNPVYDSRNNCNAIIETATNTLLFGSNNTVIPEDVTTIGDYAFELRKFTAIDIPSSVTSIGEYAFEGCRNLTSITIPSSVTSISNSTFYGCNSLTSIEIPASIASIGTQAFGDCSSLSSIVIPSSVTYIGNSAFSNCNCLTSIELPSSITSISDSIFYGCSSLTSITIPTGVSTISSQAFYHCNNLSSITIPTSVTYIDGFAFEGCSSLSSVNYSGTEEEWNSIEIGYGNDNLTDAYIKSIYGEHAIIDQGTCGDNLTWTLDVDGLLTISGEGNMTFGDVEASPWSNNKGKIKRVVIDEGIVNIESYSFQSCERLTSIDIP